MPAKTYRQLTAIDLIGQFIRITGSTNINRPRDARMLKHLAEERYLSCTEILYRMYLYMRQSLPRDIPSFCRWARRLDPGDLFMEEAYLAELLSGLKVPNDSVAYFDFALGGTFNAAEEREFKAVKARLREFIASVLDQPMPNRRLH